jgi:peptidoglycan/xylan/chitin deacetylase (PgdA/CDA1 family)
MMLKKYIRLANILFMALLLMASGMVVLTQQARAQTTEQRHINSFVYHRFGNSRYPSTNISMETFKEHLQFLKENNYRVITLGEAAELLDSPGEIPQKTAVLTVDDGYKSFITHAVPLLEQYGYKATIFVCTKYVGRSGYLSWSDIRSLRKKGYEFGNHSHSHEHFLNLSDAETRRGFKEDLSRSEDLFHRHLGYQPDLYCYPYGEYNPDMQEILKNRGYKAAAAQKSGVIYTGSDLYALPRFPMTSAYGKIEKFRSKARMKALPVIKEKPRNPEIKGKNPPKLTLRIDPSAINIRALQCFVNGRKNCKTTRRRDNELIIEAESKDKLNTRRTLYTITAPSKDGTRWYWYSHLWVNTQYGE